MIDSSIYWRHLNAVPQSPKSQTLAGLVGAYDQAQQRNQNAELMQMKRDEIQRQQATAQAAAEEAARIKQLRDRQTSLMLSVSPQSSPQGPYRQGLQQPTMQEVMPQIAALDMALGDKGKGLASLGKLVETQTALNPQPKYKIVGSQYVPEVPGTGSAIDIPNFKVETEKEKPLSRKEIIDLEISQNKMFINESSDFIKQRDSYIRVQESAKDPSPAGDLALIFNYMKILDPGSVVRESEFSTAANAKAALEMAKESGEKVPNFVMGAVNRLMTGQMLLENQRKDFVGRAGKLYKGAEGQHKKRVDRFSERAKRYNLNPDNITGDLLPFNAGEADPLNIGL